MAKATKFLPIRSVPLKVTLHAGKKIARLSCCKADEFKANIPARGMRDGRTTKSNKEASVDASVGKNATIIKFSFSLMRLIRDIY